MERVIAIDARMLEHSGIGTYLRNLLENFAATDNEYFFNVICTRKQALGSLPADRFRFIPAKSSIYSAGEQWEMARLARHAQLLHSPHYNAPLLYRGHLVVTIHDLIHLTDPTIKRSLAARFYARPVFNRVARKADRIAADSEFTKQQIVEYLSIPPSKVSVIYLGVGDHFRPCDRARASLRVSTLLGLKRPYILFVGNLKPHKNVRTLLRAFAEIRVRKNLDHHLLILGDDRKWKASLVSECGQLGIKEHVHFVPQAAYEELPWVYGAADLFVMPSLIEGFGLPVLEAMACGTPVVCSRAASLPEVGGNAVDYFDPSSEDDLAAALERVLGSHELQQTLRCRGFERVKLFPWSQTARQTLDLYRSVLHEP